MKTQKLMELVNMHGKYGICEWTGRIMEKNKPLIRQLYHKLHIGHTAHYTVCVMWYSVKLLSLGCKNENPCWCSGLLSDVVMLIRLHMMALCDQATASEETSEEKPVGSGNVERFNMTNTLMRMREWRVCGLGHFYWLYRVAQCRSAWRRFAWWLLGL